MRPRGLPVLLAPIVLLSMFVGVGRAPARAWRPPSPRPVAAACVRHDDTAPGMVRARHGFGHGVEPSSGETRALDDDLWRRLRERHGGTDLSDLESGPRRARRIVVPVRFHMITAGRLGRVSHAAVKRQIAALNAAYGGHFGGVDTRVSFRLDGIERTDNGDWFRSPHEHELPMMRAVRYGGAGTLNLVTAAVGVDLLGFSTFPQWYAQTPARDGVVIDYRSLPGGDFRGFGRGFTAVHEIGHWLGLFHTFENGCADPGDYVADTPYQGTPTHDCPEHKDTCPRRGLDPVHNFMDYSPDSCMSEFTAGQRRRIRAIWQAYRANPR